MSRGGLEDGSIVVARRDHYATVLDGETVLLSGKSEEYFGLDRVGTVVWEMIQEPQRFSAICARVVASFQVEPARCRRDIEKLVLDLEQEGLLNIQRDGGL